MAVWMRKLAVLNFFFSSQANLDEQTENLKGECDFGKSETSWTKKDLNRFMEMVSSDSQSIKVYRKGTPRNFIITFKENVLHTYQQTDSEEEILAIR